jgi:XTP/dITP diphosphohydrolase
VSRSSRIEELIVATGNPHKVEEIAQMLSAIGVRVRSLKDVPGGEAIEEPVEDGATFEANARIKALHYAETLGLRKGQACLADDSGLEVDALDGAPGVYSARYAGMGETGPERDGANNAKLLAALKAVPREKRTARFICAVCVADASGVVFEARGEFAGVIGGSPRGSNGFGYDPLLVLDDGRTSAELSPSEKNARSHRGDAVRKVAAWLREPVSR